MHDLENAALVSDLKAHIHKHIKLLEEVLREIESAQSDDIPKLGKTSRAAVLMAGLLENYYTCVETIFIRISQVFENNLSADRWHRDLLERMTLDKDIRPRVISDPVHRDLLELMRFRHFKRYYFGSAYDWTRLEELLLRVTRCHSLLLDDIAAFLCFIDDLVADNDCAATPR